LPPLVAASVAPRGRSGEVLLVSLRVWYSRVPASTPSKVVSHQPRISIRGEIVILQLSNIQRRQTGVVVRVGFHQNNRVAPISVRPQEVQFQMKHCAT
jgi:hypothetical protein